MIEIRRGTKDDLWDAYKDVAPPSDPPPPPLRGRRADRLRGRGARAARRGRRARAGARCCGRHEVQTVAVCFINAYANPAHEQRMREILEEELPDVVVSTSQRRAAGDLRARALLDHGRQRRAAPARRPLRAAAASPSSADGGYEGDLLILHSGGGVMTPETADRFAVRLAGSGIAAGAIAVAPHRRSCAASTTRSASTWAARQHRHLARLRRARSGSPTSGRCEYGYPIKFPSIEVLTIGAGGGSLAWIDDGGSLRNGPQSAGAEPGPACYGQGGEEPTNTDAQRRARPARRRR